MKYFDLKTMKSGILKTVKDETWFHSDDGIDSRRVEEGELLLPQEAFANFMTAVLSATKTALPQSYSNDATELQQHCSNDTTELQQRYSNDTATIQHNYDTEAARNSRRPAPTAKELCKIYADEVKFLTDNRNIKTLSKGMYSSYKELPKSCPRYIVEKMNNMNMRRKDGRLWTVETVSPLIAAIKINKKPSWFKVCYLIFLAVLFSVIITRLFVSSEVSHETNEIKNEIKIEQNEIKNFDRNFVLKILKQNKIKLTEYRINLICSKSYSDVDELKNEISKQYNDMLKTLQK